MKPQLYLVPVRSSRLGPSRQSSNQVLLVPSVYDAERHLEAGAPDVRLGFGRRHVERDVDNFFQFFAFFKRHVYLLFFDLIQKTHEPLKALLVSIDPDKMHLKRGVDKLQ